MSDRAELCPEDSQHPHREQCRYCGRQLDRTRDWSDQCRDQYTCRNVLAERVESLTARAELVLLKNREIKALEAQVESLTAERDDLQRRLELWRNEGYAQEVQKLQERCLKLERERDSMKTKLSLEKFWGVQ